MNIKAIEEAWAPCKVKNQLGQGAFGSVYCVEFQDPDYSNIITTTEAVKVVYLSKDQLRGVFSECGEDTFKSTQNSYINEINAMIELRDEPNIVSMHGYKILKEDENSYRFLIRMELLENLNSYWNTIKAKASDEKLKLILQIGSNLCDALKNCRQKNIIHRDIKPENIFVSKNDIFKLGDFGVSRHLTHTQSNLSKAGNQCYMAPEMFTDKDYGPKVDIYSLGLVLYQLANNMQMPLSTYDRIIGEKKFPDPMIGGNALGTILRKACAFNPDERFQDPLEFKIELEKYMQSIAKNFSCQLSTHYNYTSIHDIHNNQAKNGLDSSTENFTKKFKKLYLILINYRNAINSGNVTIINAATSELELILQELYLMSERYQYTKKETVTASLSIINQFNKYVVFFNSFAKASDRTSNEAQAFATQAEKEFQKLINMVVKMLS